MGGGDALEAGKEREREKHKLLGPFDVLLVSMAVEGASWLGFCYKFRN